MNENEEPGAATREMEPLLAKLTVMANFSGESVPLSREQVLAIKRVIAKQAESYDILTKLSELQNKLIEDLMRLDKLNRRLWREAGKLAAAVLGIAALVVLSNLILG